MGIARILAVWFNWQTLILKFGILRGVGSRRGLIEFFSLVMAYFSAFLMQSVLYITARL